MAEIINHGVCKACGKNNCYSYQKFKMKYCSPICYKEYKRNNANIGQFVYIITDPENGQIKYVGSTQNLDVRKTKNPAKQYAKQSKLLKEYMNYLQSKDMQPIFDVIDECNSKKERLKLEQFYIDYFRFIGADLLNTDRVY